MTNSTQPSVTQADRDAAVALLEDRFPDANWNGNEEERGQKIEIERVAIGEEDDHPFVQAFARYRQQALADADRDALVERINADARWIAGDEDMSPEWHNGAACAFARAAGIVAGHALASPAPRQEKEP